jgi:hypothetical protein
MKGVELNMGLEKKYTKGINQFMNGNWNLL